MQNLMKVGDTINANEMMTSLQIAEVTGKLHKDVLEAIRTMEPAWVKITGRNFPLSEYKDSTGRKLPMYQLNKTECLYIATKFNDEARARLILRWEQLERENEQQFKIPKTLSQALALAAQQAEQLEQQQAQLETQKPKVLFADAVTTSNRCVLIAELAKIITQNGYEIGQNRLFEWMRSNNYLCSKGEYYNQPTQRSMELGLFEIKKTAITHSDGHVSVSVTTKVTGKGQIYFINKFIG